MYSTPIRIFSWSVSFYLTWTISFQIDQACLSQHQTRFSPDRKIRKEWQLFLVTPTTYRIFNDMVFIKRTNLPFTQSWRGFPRQKQPVTRLVRQRRKLSKKRGELFSTHVPCDWIKYSERKFCLSFPMQRKRKYSWSSQCQLLTSSVGERFRT